MSKEKYLGDGVYVEYEEDKGMLRLTASNQNEVGGPHVIYLDGNVMFCLERYMKRLRDEWAAAKPPQPDAKRLYDPLAICTDGPDCQREEPTK